MKNTHLQAIAAFGLALALPVALAWYFDVYVNWQQKLFPLALAALGAGAALLTLAALNSLGEHRASALAWKTLLSTVVFMGVLNGISIVVKDVLRQGARNAAIAAVALAAAQLIVLFVLLLRGRREATYLQGAVHQAGKRVLQLQSLQKQDWVYITQDFAHSH